MMLANQMPRCLKRLIENAIDKVRVHEKIRLRVQADFCLPKTIHYLSTGDSL